MPTGDARRPLRPTRHASPNRPARHLGAGLEAALLCFVLQAAVVFGASLPAHAATTGAMTGLVTDVDGVPVAQAAVTVTAPSGRYRVLTDADGRFAVLGMVPDTYRLTVEAQGFETLTRDGIVVLPGARVVTDVRLQPIVKLMGKEVIRASHLGVSQVINQYVVVGTEAAALHGASPSGLSSYVRGTVQGAVGVVPGIAVDTFGDVIIRGGKANEAAFQYEDVPMPQAEVAEPGGNPISASLPTTGVAYTTVSSGAFSVADPSVLSGTVNQVAGVGTYPAHTSVTIGNGLLGRAQDEGASVGWADPNLVRRSFVALRLFDDAIEYGDRKAFYPSEIATYGLGLQSQAGWNGLFNEHLTLPGRDDLQIFAMGGQGAYDLYATPYAGERYDSFGPYPQARAPNAQVNAPSRVRGTYDIEKLQWSRSRASSLLRIRVYRSHSGSNVFGPWWDDLSFPNGPISLASTTGYTTAGVVADAEVEAGAAHELRYGVQGERRWFAQVETVPIVPEVLTSFPIVTSFALYAADRWTANAHLSLDGGVRASVGRARRSDGVTYSFAGFDPRAGATLRLGNSQDYVRLWAARYTQFPDPLEIERNVVVGTQPAAHLAPLLPEVAADYEASVGGRGRIAYKVTAFVRRETNLIDVIPTNFRAPGVTSGTAGTSLGVALPQNVGRAVQNGIEAGVEAGRLSLNATYTRGFSSSASQFGLNDLNAPATAAGHLFPLSYLPALQASASYGFRVGRMQIAPTLTFESGYPYGNGREVYVYCSTVDFECPTANGAVRQVPNDNNVNPGYNYYFLQNPALPYCPVRAGCRGGTAYNPFIGSLGTPEGDDPYTLHAPATLLVALHLSLPVGQHLTADLDVTNLLDDVAPTAYGGNPWLIGPPGYRGAPACSSPYAQWYGGSNGNNSGCYTLGNGVPTLDGRTPAMPWVYGTGGYVPYGYPAPRSIYLRLNWQGL